MSIFSRGVFYLLNRKLGYEWQENEGLTGEYRMKAMKPEIKAASFEWLCGMCIGMIPLLMHAFLHAFVEPLQDWPDDWRGETLFVSITNTGLSLIGYVLKGPSNKSGYYILIMLVTLLTLLFSSALYGAVSAGVAKKEAIFAAVCFLVVSIITSLYLTIANATPKEAAPQ